MHRSGRVRVPSPNLSLPSADMTCLRVRGVWGGEPRFVQLTTVRTNMFNLRVSNIPALSECRRRIRIRISLGVHSVKQASVSTTTGSQHGHTSAPGRTLHQVHGLCCASSNPSRSEGRLVPASPLLQALNLKAGSAGPLCARHRGCVDIWPCSS